MPSLGVMGYVARGMEHKGPRHLRAAQEPTGPGSTEMEKITMTDKKTTKTEKQAVKKQPTELKDDELDQAQGGEWINEYFKRQFETKTAIAGDVDSELTKEERQQ